MFYSNFLKLCNKINKAPSAVAVELGFQKSSVTKWSRGTLPTKANQLKIANYFGITVEELMNDEDTKNSPAQTEQENDNDIKEILASMREKALEGVTLMYDGAPIDEETMEAFEASLRFAIKVLEDNKRRGK